MKNYFARFFPGMIAVFLLSILLLSCSSGRSGQGSRSAAQKEAPRASHGILDLSNWDFMRDGKIAIEGTWLFSWKRFVDPAEKEGEGFFSVEQPGIWNKIPFLEGYYPGDGYGTLRVSVKIPAEYVGVMMGLRVTHIYTAYRLYINGVLTAENGTVGTNADESVPQYLPQVVFFQPLDETVDLVFHLSNYHHRKGGLAEPVILGTDRQMMALRERRIMAEMITVGILGIIGLYHLMIFLLRRKERSALFFSLYCFAISLRTLLLGERLLYFILPRFPWILGQKLDYLTVYLSFPLMLFFISTLYPRESHKRIPRATAVVSGFFSLAVILFPAVVFTRTLVYYFVVIVAGGSYVVTVLFLAARRRRSGARMLLAGGILFFLTGLNDILYNNGIIQTTYLSTTGLVFFTVMQTVVLSYLFTRAYSLIEIINTSLWRFVPREFLNFLGKDDIVEIGLGDQVHGRLTVLFSDIRGFTRLSETMTPDASFHFINDFLEYTGPVIRRHGGFIDKYIGDAIMALFPKGAEGAVEAAVALREETRRFNREHANYPDVDIGVSINTGTIMLGIIGEKERLESTVISDVVNVASRLEGLNKELGSAITVSGTVFEEIHNESLNFRYLGREKIRGRQEPVAVYELLDGDDPVIRDMKLTSRASFEEAVILAEEGDREGAATLFRDLQKRFPRDRAVARWVEKLS